MFYRLNGLAVRLPPLGERSDLLALVRRILDPLTEHDRQQRHRPPARCRPDAPVPARPWPGNWRQLINLLRTAALMAAGEAAITREHLSDDFLHEARAAQAHSTAAAPGLGRLPARHNLLPGGRSDPAHPAHPADWADWADWAEQGISLAHESMEIDP